MYNSNVKPYQQQILREKVLKWLSNIQNATITPGTQKVQQHKTYIDKPNLRSSGGKIFSALALQQPVYESISSSTSSTNDFFQYNNTSDVHYYNTLNSTTDYLAISNNTLFDFNWFGNDENITATPFTTSVTSTMNMIQSNITLTDPSKIGFTDNMKGIDYKDPNFITGLNLSSGIVKDFITKLNDLINKQANESINNGNDSIACRYYCNGAIKDVCSSYKNVHGYISLVVSMCK